MSPAAWTALKIRALDIAEVIDAHRVFPKCFMYGYGVLCWKIALWYMLLEHPTTEQTAFVTIVVSAFIKLFDFYAKGGRKWQ